MFKELYANVLSEYEKFWERKNTKRCILNISYRKDIGSPYRAPKSLRKSDWTRNTITGSSKMR